MYFLVSKEISICIFLTGVKKSPQPLLAKNLIK